MSRSRLFQQIRRVISAAHQTEKTDQEKTNQNVSTSRREILQKGALLGAAGLASQIPFKGAWAQSRPTLDVAIVGAGLAGLSCAYELGRYGVQPAIYEASSRVGGRCFSLRGYFPGQVAERGGELIDNLHKTILGYVNEFNLAKEDMGKQPGEHFYFFKGQHYSEAEVVEEFRAFVATLRGDLNQISSEPSALSYTENDRRLDLISLEDYLNGQNSSGEGASPLVKEALKQAYISEYGRDPSEQSSLGFLFFIHADRRSKFTPFGVFSDERYHLLNGNDQIATEINKRLTRKPELGMRLLRVKKTSSGRMELTFQQGSKTVVRVHDYAVITLPFSALRDVELDVSLEIPSQQLSAIRNLGYGLNAKMMVGFNGRPWRERNGNGLIYSDLANVQTTWETNPTNASSSRGILTDYSGGARGARLSQANVQTEADRFLTDLNKVIPGAKNIASRNAKGFVVHLEHWPSNPLSQGSYTCYRPGQFTTIAGLEGKPVGNLLFAGEHTNSFYEWQGFMEGAALSGLAVTKILIGR